MVSRAGLISVAIVLAVGGCSVNPDAPSVPMFPGAGALSNLTNSEQRTAVEIYVKSNFSAVLADIRAGGGPTLTESYRLANVPETERGVRTLQLRGDIGLYENAPGALVNAILLYGG